MFFVPCERVSLDAQDKMASLLGIIQGFTVTAVTSDLPQIPIIGAISEDNPKEVIPLRWTVFALWRKVPSDDGKKFVQACELIKPNGKQSFRQELEFEMTATFHRNTHNIFGFPTEEPGDYKLKLFLKEDKEFKFVCEYPIDVSHKTAPKT